MALAYLDTSALLKLCVVEPGTDLVAAVWDGADLVATSRLADAEVRAVLASGRRAGLLDEDDARVATAAWDRLRPGLRLVATAPAVLDEAARLVDVHPLRAADAVHPCQRLGAGGDVGHHPPREGPPPRRREYGATAGRTSTR